MTAALLLPCNARLALTATQGQLPRTDARAAAVCIRSTRQPGLVTRRTLHQWHGHWHGKAFRDVSCLSTPAVDPEIVSDFGKLSVRVEELSASVVDGLQGTSIYLVGMMGSGKSSVGKLLGKTLQYCFMDSDALIEAAAGASVAQIFANEGEAAFRDLEQQVLAELAPFRNCVVATGGGAVLRAQNWSYMQNGIVVWLTASPQLLARRVAAQGTASRPLVAAGPAQTQEEVYNQTLEKLTALAEQRQERYATSDIQISVEGEQPGSSAPVALVTYRILQAVDRRIKEDAREREERRNFQIVDSSKLPDSMKVMSSKNSSNKEQASSHDSANGSRTSLPSKGFGRGK